MSEIPHVDEDPHGLSSQLTEREEPKEAPPAKPARKRVFVGTGFFWGLVVGLLLATALVILAAQNTDDTTVRFLGWRIEAPLFLLVLGSVIAGIVLGQIVGGIYRVRRRTIKKRAAEDRD